MEQNAILARQWYEVLADAGYADAGMKVAYYYEKGIGIKKDLIYKGG